MKILVFDLDGVLADSKRIYVEVIHNSLSKHNYKIAKDFVAGNLGQRLDTTLAGFGVRKSDLPILEKEINYALVRGADSVKLCPYAESVLKKLSSKYFLILVTNSAKPFVLRFLQKYNLNSYFSELYCAEFKTKEAGFRHLHSKHDADYSEMVYIADRKTDVKVAKRAGCKIIIVLARAWDKKEFNKESFAIKTLKDLERKLASLHF